MNETLKRDEDVQIGSEKSFGIVFAVVFGLIALKPLLDGLPPHLWAGAISAIFLLAAFVAKPLLRPLNVLWFKFGLLLYKVVNPVVMAILYYTTLVPIGLLMRLCGKDPLNRTFDPALKSYWIPRDPPGPEPETMKRQF